MSELLQQLKQKNITAFTHSGKFHADDVFSAALLHYINPEIMITRGNRVPEDFEGIVFDIGRGRYDHHQRDSRVRENGIAYAAFGLLWEELGAEIFGSEELAQKFDEAFVQPLDNNDNTGEKNELAALIGSFNPVWDAKGGSDEAFFQAVEVAGMILQHRFDRYLGNERADRRVEEILQAHEQAVCSGEIPKEEKQILVLPEFLPCQKQLRETEIAFVIFPSNRGGYCVQPQKKEHSMNYKCSFPENWLGLENEELVEATGLAGASFCHKGGFLMTVTNLEDARRACKISMEQFVEHPVIVRLKTDSSDAYEKISHEKADDWILQEALQLLDEVVITEDNTDAMAERRNRLETFIKDREAKDTSCETEIEHLLHQLPKMEHAQIQTVDVSELPALEMEGICGNISFEKAQWKLFIQNKVKEILNYRPEAVYAEGNLFTLYPLVQALKEKHISVYTSVEKEGRRFLMKIASYM